MDNAQFLYLDRHLAVVEKAPGLLSQSDSRGRESLVSLLEEALQGPVFPVHRLDRETAGLMVFARTPEAAAHLSRQIADRAFQKTYLAVTTRAPEPGEGVMEDLLFKDSARNKVFVVDRARRGVKKARLRYRVLRAGESLALTEIHPETGRTHQIRVQFASRGCPLLGDRKYGGRPYAQLDRAQSEGLALLSSGLAFAHPETGEPLIFSLPLPAAFPWSLFPREEN